MGSVREEQFREYCAGRGFGPEQTDAHVSDVRGFEAFVTGRGKSLDSAGVEDMRDYLAVLVDQGLNSEERLLALGRYSFATANYPLYVYMTGMLGGREVVPNIAGRATKIAGRAVRKAVFSDLQLPPLGSPQERFVEPTRRLVAGLKARLPVETCQDVLAGNNHGVPQRAFFPLRRIYRESGIDAALRFRHESLLQTLEEHARSGKPWYEQMITPEVVAFVRRNPEIQSGVRVGPSIFVTKIPFAPDLYLRETNPKLRRYHACHCPLARTSILEDGPAVPTLWCYCSGGYEKLPFDVIFEQPVRVKVLESVLANEDRCRFEIEIPESKARSGLS